MTKRPRMRRIAKWSGVVVCVVLVAGWMTSSRIHRSWQVGEYILGVGHGAVIVSSVVSTGTIGKEQTRLSTGI